MIFKRNDFIVESLPGANGNGFSSSRKLYESIKVTKENILLNGNPLYEAVDWEVGENEKGGIITLSTDVNAEQLSENELVNKVKQIYYTVYNRLFKNSIVDKVATKNSLAGWTVGKFLSGRYTSKKGVPFGENSISIEIVGVDKDKLIDIATEMCREFKQEQVMVKEYSTGRIYFVNQD